MTQSGSPITQTGSVAPEASVIVPLGSRTRSATLQRVQSQRFDWTEVLEVAGDQRGVGQRGGGGDQRIRQPDGVGALKLGPQTSHAGGDRQLWQESQQGLDLPELSGGEEAAGQELAFGDYGNAGADPATGDVLQQRCGGRIAAQVVDEDIGVNEEPGHSQPQALESFRPRVAQLPLVAQTGREPFPQQAGGARDDLCAAGRRRTQPGDPDRNDPLHQLQALLKRLDVLQGFDVRDGHVFHVLSVARRRHTVKQGDS